MMLKFILAGGFLLFSLNTFAEGSISFFGFGEKTADQLCIAIVDTDEDRNRVFIKSVYQAVAETNGYIATDCASISYGRRISTPEILQACKGVTKNLVVGSKLVSSVKLSEDTAEVLEEVSVCKLD